MERGLRMKQITQEMIEVFKIKKLGMDMMGYTFKRQGDLSYHHLIIPRRNGGPMTFNNGAILRQNTSHDYLHIIERVDPDIFYAITSELIDENILRRIEMQNLKNIRDMLLYFEREHDHDYTKKGNLLIKREYVEQRVPILPEERRIR
jgi:hypothetical protein